MSARQIEAMLEGLPIVRWQIARGAKTSTLRVQRRVDSKGVADATRERMRRYGIGDELLSIEVCDYIAANRSGKTPLFLEAS